MIFLSILLDYENISCNQMSYDAKWIWQHHHFEFKRTIYGQSSEIIIRYIDQCCGFLLLQGISWTTVVQLRSYMTNCAEGSFQPRRLHFEDEGKIPSKTSIVMRLQPAQQEMRIPKYDLVNNQIVQPDRCVRFGSEQWDRTKIQIELYNQQVRKSRDLLKDLLIRYQEL